MTVCWDGFPPKLVESLSLRNLKTLLKDGFSSTLLSTIPYNTACAFSTFATGKLPSKHGIHDFHILKNGMFRTISSSDIQSATFYEYIYHQGKAVTLIRLPISFPPRIPGNVITERFTRGDNFTFPESLVEKVPELKSYKPAPKRSLRDKKFIEEFRRIERNIFEASKKLFKMEWDFFFIYFPSTDSLCHIDLKGIMNGRRRELIVSIEELDRFLGWFMENLPNDASIIFFSDHGFMEYKGRFFINNWLEREGLLRRMIKERSKVILASKLRKFPVIFELAKKFYRAIGGKWEVTGGKERRIDEFINVQSSSLFCPNFIGFSLFYIDERFGRRGNKEKLVEIKKMLKELADSDGEKVFKNVWLKNELYQDASRNFPDILLDLGRWAIDTPVYDIENIFLKSEYFSHSREGIFAAYGRGIKSGSKDSINIQDIAPTILTLMDANIPSDMDGKVIEEAFEKRPEINFCSPIGFHEELTPQDSKEVEERLKSLGYLE